MPILNDNRRYYDVSCKFNDSRGILNAETYRFAIYGICFVLVIFSLRAFINF